MKIWKDIIPFTKLMFFFFGEWIVIYHCRKKKTKKNKKIVFYIIQKRITINTACNRKNMNNQILTGLRVKQATFIFYL